MADLKKSEDVVTRQVSFWDWEATFEGSQTDGLTLVLLERKTHSSKDAMLERAFLERIMKECRTESTLGTVIIQNIKVLHRSDLGLSDGFIGLHTLVLSDTVDVIQNMPSPLPPSLGIVVVPLLRETPDHADLLALDLNTGSLNSAPHSEDLFLSPDAQDDMVNEMQLVQAKLLSLNPRQSKGESGVLWEKSVAAVVPKIWDAAIQARNDATPGILDKLLAAFEWFFTAVKALALRAVAAVTPFIVKLAQSPKLRAEIVNNVTRSLGRILGSGNLIVGVLSELLRLLLEYACCNMAQPQAC